LVSKAGEGEAFFADNISQCVKVQSATDSQPIFNSSIFSVVQVQVSTSKQGQWTIV